MNHAMVRQPRDINRIDRFRYSDLFCLIPEAALSTTAGEARAEASAGAVIHENTNAVR